MQLSIKATFSTFLQRNCSILSKTSVQGLRVTKIVKGNQFQGVWGELEAKKKMFPETIIYKIFETKSSFHLKQRTTGKV